MDLHLKNKVAIVTGASKGIGRAIAGSLAAEGCRVVLCSRGAKALAQAKKEITTAGGKVHTVTADVSKPSDVKKVVEAAKKFFGRIDIVVNNAGGVDKFSDFEGLTDSDWLNAYQLNVMSAVYLARYALPLLRKSPSGRIIHVSSLSGVQPGVYNPHYTASKAAVINLNKYLANVLGPERILVNVVCAGPVHSDAWERNVAAAAQRKNKKIETVWQEFEKQESAKVPLGRIGEGQDVAGLVTFLASGQASWITGSCFHVDGGKLTKMC